MTAAQLVAVVLHELRAKPWRWSDDTADLVRAALADLAAIPLGRCTLEMALVRAQRDESIGPDRREHARVLLDVLLGELDARRAARVRRIRAQLEQLVQVPA